MLFLLRYVLHHRTALPRADAKCPVPCLPCKRLPMLRCPSARSLFRLSYEIGNRLGPFDSRENMNVIGYSADRYRRSTKAAKGTADVGVQLVTPRWVNGGSPVLCGKHDVDIQAEIRCGHSRILASPFGSIRSGRIAPCVRQETNPDRTAERSQTLARRSKTPALAHPLSPTPQRGARFAPSFLPLKTWHPSRVLVGFTTPNPGSATAGLSSMTALRSPNRQSNVNSRKSVS